MSAPIELDYTARDFDSIRAFLVSAARGFMPEWVAVGEPGDFGTLLLELYAFVGDTMNYYIDRAAAEPFLATAVRRQSILGIADLLGYVPVAQQSASGAVTFSLDAAAYTDTTLTIPAGTVVQTQQAAGQPAIFFETVGHTFVGGVTRSAVQGVNEGRTVAAEFLAFSNGAPLQEYVLRFPGVIHRSLTLTLHETDTQTVVWSYVDRLVDANPDASVFTTYLDDQLFMHVVFGDNVAGRIPPNGARIDVGYRYGAGAAGNVIAGTIVQITPPIAGVSVTNAVQTTGGADNESIDQMRFSIPRAGKLRDRAVTLDDFAALAHQVPGVAKAVAQGLYYTLVKLYIAPVGGGYPTTDLKSQVATYLLDRTLVGVSLEVHPLSTAEALYQPITIHLVVHVLPTFGQLTVVNAVRDALTNLFSFESMDFGIFVSQGSVYHTALAVPGVDYIVLNDMRFTTGTPGTTTDLQAGATLIPSLADADLVITAVGGLV